MRWRRITPRRAGSRHHLLPESKQTDVAFKKTLFLQRQLSPPSVGPPPRRNRALPPRQLSFQPIPLLVFSICHYSTYTLGPTLKISPCLLGGHPTKRWPMCLCLPTSLCLALPLYYVRARVRTACVLACLQPACANFILHTTAPRSHYIAWLGLLQKKTNDGRSCTDTGLIPLPYFGFKA